MFSPVISRSSQRRRSPFVGEGHIQGDVAQWLESWNSNPKTLGSIPGRGRVNNSFSVPPSQLLCRLVPDHPPSPLPAFRV